MQVRCSVCDADFSVNDDLAGRQVMCRNCHSIVSAGPGLEPSSPPTPTRQPEPEQISDWIEEPAARRTRAAEAVTCPMCGARNKPTAEECVACGETLTPKIAGASFGVWRDGKLLVMDRQTSLPYRCVVTNEPAVTTIRRNLSWHPPLVYLVLLISPLIYIIVALIVRKKASIDLPLSERIRRKRSRAIIGAWLSGLGFLFTAFLGFPLAISLMPSADQDMILVVGVGLLFVMLIALLVCSYMTNLCPPTKITDRRVWLRGVHADYLAALRDWPGE